MEQISLYGVNDQLNNHQVKISTNKLTYDVLIIYYTSSIAEGIPYAYNVAVRYTRIIKPIAMQQVRSSSTFIMIIAKVFFLFVGMIEL